MIHAHQITAMVLAGGRGTRMGGLDKGLQPYQGVPLALHALQRLRAQDGELIGQLTINANRHLPQYQAFGVPVWADGLADQPGPLAGMLTGLQRAERPYLLTVPCDAPRFPLDLAQRLAAAFDDPATEIAMAIAPDDDGAVRAQPVFCLLPIGLQDSLARFTSTGERQVRRWMSLHRCVNVPFDTAGDDPRAFANTNTLEELRALERNAP